MNPMRILVRLVLNWIFLEIISRFFATLAAMGCITFCSVTNVKKRHFKSGCTATVLAYYTVQWHPISISYLSFLGLFPVKRCKRDVSFQQNAAKETWKMRSKTKISDWKMTLEVRGRAASGGALATKPPRANQVTFAFVRFGGFGFLSLLLSSFFLFSFPFYYGREDIGFSSPRSIKKRIMNEWREPKKTIKEKECINWKILWCFLFATSLERKDDPRGARRRLRG